MENIVLSLLSGLLGSSIGGILVWLAVQKIIDDRVEKKQEPMWTIINNIKKDIKDDYCSKDVCAIIHEHVEKDNKRLEETLKRIEEKIDDIKNKD